MSCTQTNQSMNDKREFKQVDTSTNAKMDKPQFPEDRKEPTLPVFIPMRIVRWIMYSIAFGLLLLPFLAGTERDGVKVVCGGTILGWFASQFNALINKK